MRGLENLVRTRLTDSAELTRLLARYQGQSAVFYQLAPHDTQTGWERAEGIISLAHPQFRDELIAAAEKMHIWRRSNKR